jgi:hypothetical protein
VTFAPDDIDWDDEVRVAIEERASLSPDALTGMEANLRFAGPETMETKIFGRLSAWQNWIFQRPNAVGPHGALRPVRQPTARVLSTGSAHECHRTTRQDPQQRRPLTSDRAPARPREWQPNFLDWWMEMGPEGFQQDDIYLRTAISVDKEGWAKFGYVKMPDYRWGIFLNPRDDRRARSTSAITWASPPGSRCRASTATRCGASS